MPLQPLQPHYITQLTIYSLIFKIYSSILHLLLPLSLLWLHAPFTSTSASSPSTSTFDRFPLLHSPLRNHIPYVDIHSHISHLLFYSHSSQSSFCHLYSNTPQIYSHIPQMTWSIPVSEKVTLRYFLLQPHSLGILIQPYFRVISTATSIIRYLSTAIFPMSPSTVSLLYVYLQCYFLVSFC